MPTYRLTAPDGKVYNVTGEGTGEEALAQLQAQLGQTQPSAPPQNSAPSAVAEPEESFTGALGRYATEAGRGARLAGQRASAGLTGMLPRGVENFLVKQGLSPSQEQLDYSKRMVDESGPAATVGQMGADVGMQMLPSSILSKATAGLTAGRAIAANLAGQGGLNAALTPDSEGRGTGAAIGAGSAALGGAAARVLGGPLRTMVSKEGRQLLDAGVPLTPGQAVSGPNAGGVARAIRTTEDQIGSIPIVGDVIRNKARNAANAFSTQQINEALAPLGQKVTGVGHEAIDSALDKISKSYDSALPDISVPANVLPTLVDDAIIQVKQTNPLFNTTQEEAVRLYDGRRIQELVARGGDLDGRTAQKIDQELGEYIRKFRKKNTVYDDDMAEAFMAVQQNLRTAMQGATPEAKQVLEAGRMARAKLEPILQAAKPTTGEFTAGKLVQTIAKTGKPTDFQRAGSHVLPSVTPDSGTAGRTFIGNMLQAPALGAGAAVAGAGGGLLPAIAAGAGAASLYTKPGMKYLTEGVHPIIEALRKKGPGAKLSRDETEQLMQFLSSQPIRAGLNARGE